MVSLDFPEATTVIHNSFSIRYLYDDYVTISFVNDNSEEPNQSPLERRKAELRRLWKYRFDIYYDLGRVHTIKPKKVFDKIKPIIINKVLFKFWSGRNFKKQ